MTSSLGAIKTVIVMWLSFLGLFGASVQFAAANDAVFVLSWWLLAIYTCFGQMYRVSLQLFRMLFKLFRGRKFNILRARDDNSSFGIQELYLGVLIITMIFFLLPTIAVFYYYAFISAIVRMMAMQIIFIAAQVFFTEFPYFLLMWSLS